jgi:carbon-monoxide dehydrogenase medium subunit
MIPAAFDYVRPASVAEATAFLSQNPDAKVVAGGHSLIPLMKLRLAQPKYLVDITRIPGLRGVSEADGTVQIGALTTHYEIESSPIIRERLLVLAETAAVIGDVQVRNRGTVGGSLAHADPAADYPAPILALDATINATGPNGNRSIPATGFFVDLLTTALQPNELITSVTVPVPAAGSGASYQKFPHPASRYAIAGVAAVVRLNPDGTVQDARIGVTGAGTKAIRATAAEAAIKEQPLDDAALDRAGAAAAEAVDATGDIHASADYRRHLVREYTKRALRAAGQRAKS